MKKRMLAIFLCLCMLVPTMGLTFGQNVSAEAGYVIAEIPADISRTCSVTSSGDLMITGSAFTFQPVDLTPYGFPEKDLNSATMPAAGKIGLQFDMYVSGDEGIISSLKTNSMAGQIELTSGGFQDSGEINITTNKVDWQNGKWVRYVFDLNSFAKRGAPGTYDVDGSKINFFRIYLCQLQAHVGKTLYIDMCNVCLVDLTKEAPSVEEAPIGRFVNDPDADVIGYEPLEEIDYYINTAGNVSSYGIAFSVGKIQATPIDLTKYGFPEMDTTSSAVIAKGKVGVQMDIWLGGDDEFVEAVTSGKVGVGQIEMTSGGMEDKGEITYDIAGNNIGFKAGEWKRIVVDLGSFHKRPDAKEGFNVDPSAINYFRVYMASMESLEGINFQAKFCNCYLVDLTKPLNEEDAPELGDGSFDPEPPVWAPAPIPAEFDNEDRVVMGYNLKEYVEEHFETEIKDYGPIIQSLANGLFAAGGGVLYIPAGHYPCYTPIVLPVGVTMYGDWQNPDEHPEVKGTVLDVYYGKGKPDGTAFITQEINTMVANMAFWYPEQDVNAPEPYVPTIELLSPHTHVRKVTLVNSYKGIYHVRLNRCPNASHIFGTPLFYGVDMDQIGDIMRLEDLNFAPDYWINSGLPGAPTSEEDEEMLRTYLRNYATGIILGRDDWSYMLYSKVTGYATGLMLKVGVDGTVPNGHLYGLTFDDCATAIYVYGVGGSGELISNCKITNCDYGVWCCSSGRTGGVLKLMDFDISTNVASLYIEERDFVSLLSSVVRSGPVVTKNGWINLTDNQFLFDGTHIKLDNGTPSAILMGNTDANGNPATYENVGHCPITVDDTKLDIEVPVVSEEWNGEHWPQVESKQVYIVDTLDKTGETDVTAALQIELDKVGKTGGVCYLPSGTYRIDGSVTVPTGVELRGVLDFGRVPYNCGTVFAVVGSRGNPDGDATVILSEGSGIRAITFDYPEMFDELIEKDVYQQYPYAIQGRGADIYILNMNIRNGWRGVDLMTYKCDRHYVDYLFGFCFDNFLKVGHGCTDGIIRNYHDQSAGLTDGGLGWTLPDVWDVVKQHFYPYTQNYIVHFIVGDVNNELISNGFNYNGFTAFRLIEEETGSADVTFIGDGVDHTSINFEIQNAERLDFINTQLVSFDLYKVDPIEDMRYFLVGEDFDGEINMYSVTMWDNPETVYEMANGTMNAYGLGYYISSEFAKLGENAKVNIIDGVMRVHEANVATIPFSGENAGNVSINGAYMCQTIDNNDQFGCYDNIMSPINRWDFPKGVEVAQNAKMLFTEAFTNYDSESSGKAFNYTSFGETASVSTRSGVVNMSLGQDGTSVGISGSSSKLTGGNKDSLYRLETRVKIDEFCDHDFSRAMVTTYINRSNPINLAIFDKNNGFLVTDAQSKQEIKVADFAMGTWYRVAAEIDMRDPANKTYTVYLLDDTGKTLAKSETYRFADNTQNEKAVIDQIFIGMMTEREEEMEETTGSMQLDYVFAAYGENSTFGALGDVNGDGKVDSTDARLILQYYAKKIGEDGLNTGVADVNGDSKVDSTDARLILQFYAKKITDFSNN